MNNHRSAEVLSALILFVVSLSTLAGTGTSQVLIALNAAGAMPEWAIISAISSLVCLLSLTLDSSKVHTLSKFVSGCVWGSVVLVLGVELQWIPLFWIAIVLFGFDLFTVITGSHSWSQRSRS